MKGIVKAARDQQRAYVASQLGKGVTVREIAAALDVTTQRVYQIKAAAEEDKRKLKRRRRTN